MEHVVGITDPRDGLARDGAAMLDIGEHVGQHLARMMFIGQAIDNRYARIGGEAIDDVLAEGADHDDVAHARHHLRCVFDRLAAPQLAVARVQVDCRAAELMHAAFERQASACRVFLEHHDQRAVEQRVVWLVILELALDDARAFDHIFELAKRQVRKLQEVFDGHK